jgi:hypothetical protein
MSERAMPFVKPRVSPLPPNSHRQLRRCGGQRCAARARDDDRLEVRRQRDWGTEPLTVPDSVHETLRTPGLPLDPATRAFFEPRFGHDFGRVRIHADARAAESARAVNALAYTAGQDVVFAAGRYAPATLSGRSLLAHELTHVVQQANTRPGNAPVALGPAEDRFEREASAAADVVAESPEREAVAALALAEPRLQRQGLGDILSDAGQKLGDIPIAVGQFVERAQEEQTRAGEKTAANMARRILTQSDLDTIQAAVPSIPAPTRIVPGVRGVSFVLHDTASPVGAKRIAELAGQGRRSSGHGAGAFVPRDVPATATHTPFFGPRRPTATESEKGEDVLIKANREKGYRAVWKEVDTAKREAALDAVLAAQSSPKAEAAKERKTAISQLAAASGDVHSAAVWAVEDLCASVAGGGGAALAATPAQAPALETACTALSTLTLARADRIASTVNVELVAEAGSHGRTTGKLIPLPPYTETQYDNVAQLYLRAAFEAKFFPEITTHFQVDKALKGHSDPRCFKLEYLYGKIAALMKHPKGTTYGFTPSYGTGAAHNVWWNDTVCGGSHP